MLFRSDLCDKRFETIRLLEVECNEPVRSEGRIRLETPKETDGESGNITSALYGSPSKHAEALCEGGNDLQILPLLSSFQIP